MNSRIAAIALTVLAAAAYVWRGTGTGGIGPALLAALLALAAILLASGTTRTVLAVLATLGWLGAVAADLAGGFTWLLLAAVAGLVAALLTAVRGSSWPGWSDRYSRSANAVPGRPDDPRAMWDSLDRGEDPTHNDDAPRAP